MEITAKREQNGHSILGVGVVSFELTEEAIEALQKLLNERLSQNNGGSTEALQRKIRTYRNLATKMITVDDVSLQSVLPRMKPE